MKETTWLEENQKIVGLLKKISIFKTFDDEDFESLLKISKLHFYRPGEFIISEGSTDTLIYFLIQGTVKIIKNQKTIVTLRRRGDIFGEMGVIEVAPRSAAAFATEDTVCLATDFMSIKRITDRDKLSLGYLFYRIISEILANRLKTTTEELMKYTDKKSIKPW